MNTRIGLLLLGSLLFVLHDSSAQSTAFTYQGRLNDGNNPANGFYDLRFALYDSASGSNSVGGALTNAAVTVSNGLFTVMLDFGSQFNGADRWLEIGVRTNDAGTFALLTPRQQVTPAPYAIKAQSASSLASLKVLQNASGAPNLIGGAADN